MEVWQCGLCTEQTDVTQYPQTPLTANMPTITLRCGHEYHTHCYMYRTMVTGALPVYEICPNSECNQSIFPDTIREFYREEHHVRRENMNIVTLWNENDEFRTDLRVLLKQRNIYRKNFSIFRPLRAGLRRRFANSVRAYKEGIIYEKREHIKLLSELPERKIAIRSMNKYRRQLDKFNRKYDIWTSRLRALRGIKGAPRIPLRGFNVSWADRRPSIYDFRVRI